MKNFLFCISVLMTVVFCSVSISAKKEDFFLDAKSHLVGIATVGDWVKGDLYEKFVVTEIDGDIHVAKWLNNSVFPSDIEMLSYLNGLNAGRIVIDRLLGFDGISLDDSELRKRALLNANRRDKERASKHIIDATTLLQDDLDPILMHNFLFVRVPQQKRVTNKEGQSGYVTIYNDYLYKVVMTPELIEKIYECWENPSEYKKIRIPLKHIPTPEQKKYEDLNTLTEALEKTNSDFMLYGQLLSRSAIDLPASLGVKNGDNVTIYRQEIDRNGKPYSKRIARGKVSGFDDGGRKAHFFRVAGNAGSRKNGDVATTSHSKNFSFAVMGEYAKHNWGINLKVDHSFGFRKSGLYSHLLFNFGAALTENPGKEFSYLSQNFDSPIFINAGLGWGIGKTFIGLFDLMPYFMAQYEAAMMSNSDSDAEPRDITGTFVRIPVGLRFNINLVYPVRLSIEAGYAFRFRVGDREKAHFTTDACDIMGVKRDGIFLGAGLYF